MINEYQNPIDYYKEGEPRSTDIINIQTGQQSIGVISEYGDEIIQAICRVAPSFADREGEDLEGYRDKFTITLDLPNGTSKKLMVKSKYSQDFDDNAITSTRQHREEIANAPKFDEMLRANGLRPGMDTPLSAETKIRSERNAVRNETVLNEILATRKAAYRYKKAYGEELPIEKPVGYVVDRKGRKWVIFEYISDIADLSELDKEGASMIDEKRSKFGIEMADRLESVGVYPGDLVKNFTECKNIVFTGDPEHQDSLQPVLVDTEEWLVK